MYVYSPSLLRHVTRRYSKTPQEVEPISRKDYLANYHKGYYLANKQKILTQKRLYYKQKAEEHPKPPQGLHHKEKLPQKALYWLGCIDTGRCQQSFTGTQEWIRFCPT